MPPNGPNRFAWLLLGLGGAAVLAVIFFLAPATHGFYPRCPLKSLAGLDCPTCGGLRAVHRLLHGEFRAAYALNPFLFWFLPVAGLLAVRPLRARAPWLLWAALAALIAWFLWRNFI